jgi:hypothetical protein
MEAAAAAERLLLEATSQSQQPTEQPHVSSQEQEARHAAEQQHSDELARVEAEALAAHQQAQREQLEREQVERQQEVDRQNQLLQQANAQAALEEQHRIEAEASRLREEMAQNLRREREILAARIAAEVRIMAE